MSKLTSDSMFKLFTFCKLLAIFATDGRWPHFRLRYLICLALPCLRSFVNKLPNPTQTSFAAVDSTRMAVGLFQCLVRHHHHHHLFNKTDWQNAIIHNIKKHENLIDVIEENFVQMITTVVRLLGGKCWLINVFEQHSVYVISAISFDK